MSELPIDRYRSGHATPHRPYPADTRIIADHGLHHLGKVDGAQQWEWVTVVGLWHGGRRIAHELVWTSPASEPDQAAEQPAVDRLLRWWRVLAGMADMEALQRQREALQIDIDQAESLDDPRPVLYRERAGLESRMQALREVMLARARMIGPSEELEHITFDGQAVGQSARQRFSRDVLPALAVWRTERDPRIREALAAGLEKSEISRLTGVGRTTIDRILSGSTHG